jgi:hypothetical protein
VFAAGAELDAEAGLIALLARVLNKLADGQNAQSKGTTLFETLQIRDLLLAVNRGNEETLEQWGFDVAVGSTSAPKKKDSAKPA